MKTYVFDLDGTIVSHGKPIHKVIADTIRKLAETDEVIFASARPVRDMMPLIPAGLNELMMVGCNGGMAWRNGTCLFSNVFENKVSEKIISFLESENIPYVIDGNWNYALSSTTHSFHGYMRSLSKFEVEKEEILDDGVSKILILNGSFREKFDSFLSKNKYYFNVNYHKADDCFDITPQKEDKYLALRKIGVDFSNTISFGNDANDYVVLDNSRVSVFVGSMSDYPDATYYCRTEYIPTLLPAIIDTFERRISKHYVNKQQIAFQSIEDILKLQKIISSWVPCEPQIELKLELARIASWLGYSLEPLYSIALERSIFNKENPQKKPSECNILKRKCSLYNLNSNILLSLKKSLIEVTKNLNSAKNTIVGNRYHRINERIDESSESIRKTFKLIDDILDKKLFNHSKHEKIEISEHLYESPEIPHREKDKNSSNAITPLMKIMYSNYINLEVPTIECCCAIINDFKYGWNNIPFITDLSRQIEDEIFHSKILMDEYKKRGGNGEAVTAHFRFWEMAKNEDLPTRLYIHQKMGEWIGIDAAINQIMNCEDSEVTEIYTSIVSDELNHTRLGTRWIDEYSEDYSEVKNKALLKRSEFNETDEGPVKFQTNEYVCGLCNFKEDEVNDLISREKEFGVIHR
ncbi:DUF455 family protein [Xenorhabdus nematophila]|uniref:DUF455 family protein n=1 Tax=Xenorhabdus nematophila TaxID=628 RepID=UPI0032B734C7